MNSGYTFSDTSEKTETEKSADTAEPADTLIDISGILVDENETPVTFTAGSISSYNDILLSEEIRFQTDDTGSFSIEGLIPGSYMMLIHDSPQRYFSLNIPSDISSGAKNVGTVQYGKGNSAASEESSGGIENKQNMEERE